MPWILHGCHFLDCEVMTFIDARRSLQFLQCYPCTSWMSHRCATGGILEGHLFFHLEINAPTVVQRLFSTVHTCIFWLVLLPFVTQEEMYPCIYKWSLRPEYSSICLVFNWIFFSLQHKTKFSTSSIYSNSYFNLLRLILQCRLP